MKLLLAVDSVTTLDVLLNQITDRSWPIGTEAHVISVVEDGDVSLETWRAEGYGVSAIQQEMRNRGEQITSRAIGRLQAVGIPVEVTVMRGDPAFLISRAARKSEADLIFIRAHNRNDFRNWVLGSVAKSVVQNAPCSVEIVRSTATEQQPLASGAVRILLASDGSDASLTAARAVAETNWPTSSEVKVISVIDPMVYSLEEIGLLSGKRTERAHRAIGQAISVLRDASFNVSGEVVAGNTVGKLIERASKWNADLIVLGTNERRGLKRLLLGSISAAVANLARCSVRVIKPHASRNDKSSFHSSARARAKGATYKFDNSLVWEKAA